MSKMRQRSLRRPFFILLAVCVRKSREERKQLPNFTAFWAIARIGCWDRDDTFPRTPFRESRGGNACKSELSQISLKVYFPSGKLVKYERSTGGRPYFSFASAMALIRKAMFRARLRMVCRPSKSFFTSSAVKPCT